MEDGGEGIHRRHAKMFIATANAREELNIGTRMEVESRRREAEDGWNSGKILPWRP